VCHCGRPRNEGGSAVNRMSTNKKYLHLGVHIPTPPPPRSQYILRFGHIYVLYDPDVRDGGGGVCQTADVGQGVQNSVFARTSLMDDPL